MSRSPLCHWMVENDFHTELFHVFNSDVISCMFCSYALFRTFRVALFHGCLTCRLSIQSCKWAVRNLPQALLLKARDKNVITSGLQHFQKLFEVLNYSYLPMYCHLLALPDRRVVEVSKFRRSTSWLDTVTHVSHLGSREASQDHACAKFSRAVIASSKLLRMCFCQS